MNERKFNVKEKQKQNCDQITIVNECVCVCVS